MLLQGQQCIKILHRHILHQTKIGLQIRINLAWIQQEAGTAHPTLENTHLELDCVKDGWVLGIRHFLQLVGAEIKFLDIPSPQTYRQGNSYMMDLFRTHGVSLTER
jgi:hypothetical protein